MDKENINQEEVLNSENKEEEIHSNEVEQNGSEAEEQCDCNDNCSCHEVENKVKKVPFLKSLGAIIIDQLVIAVAALLILLIFGGILKGLGYYIKTEYVYGFLFIMYVIASVFYSVIMETTSGSTLGKKLTKSRVNSIE